MAASMRHRVSHRQSSWCDARDPTSRCRVTCHQQLKDKRRMVRKESILGMVKARNHRKGRRRRLKGTEGRKFLPLVFCFITFRRAAPDGSSGIVLEVVLLVVWTAENHKPNHKHSNDRKDPFRCQYLRRIVPDKIRAVLWVSSFSSFRIRFCYWEGTSTAARTQMESIRNRPTPTSFQTLIRILYSKTISKISKTVWSYFSAMMSHVEVI